MASSTLARNCFCASNPVPALRMFERVWACAPRIAHTYVLIESLRRSTPACVKPSDLSRMNTVIVPDMSRLWRSGGRRGHRNSAHAGRRPTAPYTCSKIRGLGTRGLAFVSSPFPGTRRTQSKAACRPWHRRFSDTKNEIFLREGRLAAPQEYA